MFFEVDGLAVDVFNVARFADVGMSGVGFKQADEVRGIDASAFAVDDAAIILVEKMARLDLLAADDGDGGALDKVAEGFDEV